MFHIIRSRAKLVLGLLVILTLLLSVGFLTTHPTIKAHADDGDDGTDSTTSACVRGLNLHLYAQGLDHPSADVNHQLDWWLSLVPAHCPLDDKNVYWQHYNDSVDARLQVSADPGKSNLVDAPSGKQRLTSFADPASIAPGSTICTSGGASGIRCGQILRMDYAPSYVTNRASSFYLVDTSCDGGDSGAVWYFDSGVDQGETSVVGITSGRRNETGQCIVDPIQYIRDAFDADTHNGTATGIGNFLFLPSGPF